MKRILRRSAFAALVITLAFPTAALAARGDHPAPKPNPTVMFVLRGTITAYTPGSSVSITVKSANFRRAKLDGLPLTFTVNSDTKLVRLGTDSGTSLSDKGVVKVRAPFNSTATSIVSGTTAFEIIDQGKASI